MKNKNGITLIALVITVIILVILAGVAISMITGNEGLFTKANEAATVYNQKAQEEAEMVNALIKDNPWINGGSSTGGTVTPQKPPRIPEVTNMHIGDYIDLGTNLLDTTTLSGEASIYDYENSIYFEIERIRPDETIKADYRIFYVEGETVYAILADYLPNSTNVLANAGITELVRSSSTGYAVDKNSSRTVVSTVLAGPYTRSNNSTLVNSLTGSSLANKNVSVSLAPTVELLENSYKTKYPSGFLVDPEEIRYSDYFGELEGKESIYLPRLINDLGYWLATETSNREELKVQYYGVITTTGSWKFTHALRPVVVLGEDVGLKYNETREVWEVVTE